jgi:Fe-Mn family superoxide dismutase
LEELAEALVKNDLQKIVSLQSSIKFNGGSHINHSLYWENLAPTSTTGGKLPADDSKLGGLIKKEFGSFDNFITEFNKKAAGIQGSGWGWLGYDKVTKEVVITETPNQDPLTTSVPLLTIDMWEHAWYLQYKNVKADYLKEIWKVVNWGKVEERLAAAL